MSEGHGPISTRQVDQRAVVVDHAPGFPSRGRGERPIQVGGRFRVATVRRVEDPAVEGGIGQRPIELEGAGVVADGRISLAERLAGSGAVEVAFGRLGGQRDADAEGVGRVFVPPELIGAEPLVEVRPEILRPEFEGEPELFIGAGEVPGPEVGPPQVAILPGRAGLPAGVPFEAAIPRASA